MKDKYDIIKAKLEEIQEILKPIPEECKGASLKASINRNKYIRIKFTVNNLLEELYLND